MLELELGLVKTGLRAAQILWCLLLTALIGNVIALSLKPAPSATAAVGFTMFVVVASWLAAIYGLLARLFPSIESVNIQLPADAAGVLLTFIDSIVLSAKLGVANCGDIDKEKVPDSWIAWGSSDDGKRCREIQAGAVFMWFLFACFVGSGYFTWSDSRRMRGFSIPTSKPSMTEYSV